MKKSPRYEKSKSANKSKNAKTFQANIYLKKIDIDDPAQKSSQHGKSNKKSPVTFNKPTNSKPNFHHTRSNKELLQNALYKL